MFEPDQRSPIYGYTKKNNGKTFLTLDTLIIKYFRLFFHICIRIISCPDKRKITLY